MARWKNYLGSAKAISTTAATYTWTGNDLPTPAPGSSLVAVHVIFAATTGAQTQSITKTTRIRIKANGNIIYDIATDAFRSLVGRFTPSNLVYGASSASFTIPFNLFDLFDDDQADMCAFPLRTIPTVEITTGNTPVASNAYLAWTLSSVTPTHYPVLLGQQMNIGASPVNGTFPFTENGQVRAIGIDSTNLSRARIKVGGFDYVTAPGGVPDAGAGTLGDAFRELEAFEQDATFTKPTYQRIPMVPAPQGLSNIEISGNSSVAVTDEMTMWAIRPQ